VCVAPSVPSRLKSGNGAPTVGTLLSVVANEKPLSLFGVIIALRTSNAKPRITYFLVASANACSIFVCAAFAASCGDLFETTSYGCEAR
jgi:hypothetical protein